MSRAQGHLVNKPELQTEPQFRQTGEGWAPEQNVLIYYILFLYFISNVLENRVLIYVFRISQSVMFFALQTIFLIK